MIKFPMDSKDSHLDSVKPSKSLNLSAEARESQTWFLVFSTSVIPAFTFTNL